MSYPEGLILLGEYGSVAQGTATDQSDHDYMGVVIETREQVIGLDNFETKRTSDAKTGEKSKPGESDTTYHGLRKFVHLAASGNPTVGSILALPKYEVMTPLGAYLVENRDAFWSLKGGKAYLGYLHAQIKKLEEFSKPKRPELVDEYGYDVKFAYHAYRLGVQGAEYLFFKSPNIPMFGTPLLVAKRFRAGEYTYTEAMEILYQTEDKLQDVLDAYSSSGAGCPAEPNRDRLNSLLVEMHEDYWNGYTD